MPVKKCPIEGFEQVSVTFPEQWLVSHNETFWNAYREAGDKVSHNAGLLYGCVAVCEKISGLPDTAPGEWPLQVFNWLIDTVYRNSLEKALHPSKNSSAPAPTTPKE